MAQNMADDVRRFREMFGEIADKVFIEATEKTVAGVAAKTNALVANSPVAEGDFVSDWDVGVNHWPFDVNTPPDPKKRKTARRLKAIIQTAKFGDTIFIENTDPAAGPLENGWSKQAPNGVMRLAARQWRRRVRTAGFAFGRRLKHKAKTG